MSLKRSIVINSKPSQQNGIDWNKYQRVDKEIFRPYFTLTNNATHRISYFSDGLKTTEIEYLWNKYVIDFENILFKCFDYTNTKNFWNFS